MITLPKSKNENDKLESYLGKTVVAGIRPSNIFLKNMELSNIAAKSSTIKSTVELKELMGSESYIYVTIDNKRFNIRMDCNFNCDIGDTLDLIFDTEMIHLFDKETGVTITN